MAGFLLPLLLLTPLASVAQVDTLFWFAQPDVWRRYTTLPVNYCVTTFDQAATVTIDLPADPSFAPITFSVPANSFHQHNVASLYSQMVTSTSNAPRNRGVRIRATAPVSCYFEVTGDNSEIYTLKGRNGLGTDFLVPTQTIYPNHPTFNISSSIEIVATEDDTQLEITPRVALTGGVAAGSTTFFSLNRGQTYRVRSSSLSANGHLYNTLIHTTKPVAVNSTDDLVEPTANADLVGEQILPVSQIGRRYVALNSFYNISSGNQHLYSSNIFIFPTQDNTIVTVNGGPLSPIQRGSSLSFRLTGPATLIEANNPIVVFQTTTSGFEMGGTMLPHLECTGSHRVVHKVPTDIDQQPKLAIVVATEHKAHFALNGNPMPASWFQTVPGDPTLSYSLRTVSIPTDSIISVENNAGRFQMGIIDLTFNVGASCTYGYFSDYAQASYVHLDMDTVQCSDSAVVFTYDAPNIDNLTLTGPDGFQLTAPPFVIPADAPHLSGRYHLSGVDTANCHNLLSDSIDITFRRCNTRIALPYCEDFDSYPYGEGNMPDYWTGYNTLNIDNGRYPLITREYHRSGNQSFGFHIMNNNRCYAILPDFAVDSIQQLNLSFFARIKPSERGQLVMGVLTDSTDINSFIPLDTLSISHLQWQPVTYSYSHYHGPAQRAAMLDIQLPGYTFGNIYIDDFAAGLWQQPSIQVSSPSSITVTAAPGQSEDFWIEYGAPGFHPGVDPSTIVHITSSPFVVTGLQPSTIYDIYAYPYLDNNTLVRSTCNAPVIVTMPQPPPETIIDTSVCINHLPVVWHSHTLLSDTSISETLALSPLGYDSIVTLHLSLLPTYSIDTLASPCDQIAWRGHTFTSDTLFVDSLIATNGCDSVTTLHLTLRHSSSAIILDTALENDLPRTLLGHTFSSDTANFAITTANAQGCDSLISYSLHVLWNNRTSLDSTVCQSLLPLQWNHRTFHAAGTLLDTLVNTLGSDSIIAMTLHVAPTFDDTLAVSICDNQTYSFEGTTYAIAGTYSHLLHTAAFGCDSLRTLSLDVRSTSSGDTLANPCDGLLWRGATFTSDTVIADTAILHSVFSTNAVGCDSVTTLHLTLRHSSSATILDTALENDLPRTILGHSFHSDTADVAITTANAQGCDSLISYSLHVLWNNRTSLDSTVCQSLLPLQWNHRTFHAAGTLLDTLVNSLGSDSIIAMTLHVAPTFDDTLAVSICDNQTYSFEGTTYALAGTYSQLLHTAAFGCDSLRTLSLDIRSTSSGDTLANPCDVLLWRGATFTSDTVIADTTILQSVFSTNAVGCDSVTTLHLTLRHSSSSVILDTALENDLPRTLLGHSFLSDTANFAITTANAQGCDSLVSYSLHVHRNRLTNLDTSVCANELPFEWHGKSFADNGTTPLRDTLWLNASSGADSTVALTVDVHPVYDLHIYDTLCDNQSLSFESQELASTGIYEYSLSTHTYACDSLRTLHLTVHPTYNGILYDTICQNQRYSWGTPLRDIHLPDSTLHHLSAADTATAIPAASNTITLGDTLTSIHGCDSVSQLSLTIRPVLDIHYYDTACYAALGADGWDTLDYPFEGQHFDTTTLYTHHAASGTTGCDSLRTLHLVVAPTYDRHFYDTIYQGDAALFEGHEYTVPGRYEHPLATASRSCDSILTLHLTVAPVSRFDTTLCRNHLPLLWHGQSFPAVNDIAFSGNRHTLVDSLHTSLPDGRDSLTVFTLTLLDTSARTDVVLACGNYTWIDSVNYTASTQSPAVTFANALGCDSVVHLDLRLTFTQTIDDYHSPCDSLVWLDGRVFRNDTVGIIDTLHTLSGCDSIMRLHLTLRHSSHIDLADTSCPHNAYSWHSFGIPADTSGRFLLFDTLVNAEGCDSTLRLDLFKPGETVIDIVSDIDCRLHGHHVTATATADLAAADSLTLPHLAWSARPADPLLDSLLQSPGYTFTSGATILLQPAVETQYTLTADYSATHRCPDTATITLKPVVTPQVQLKVTPLLIPYSERRFTAYDLDHNHSYARTWYIDNEPLGDHSPVIHGQANFDADSVIVTLELADSICSDTATRVIHIDDLAVYAPNAFTPSREDNNRFVIVTRGVARGELTIYQRDGLLVYHTDDYTQGWDGRTSDGTPCIQGNYVWKLVYQPTLWPGSQRTQVGSILLIR